MSQETQSENDKLQNYCMAWGVDNISFLQFDFISESKCWNEYNNTIKLVRMICESLKLNDLIEFITVTPSFVQDSPGIITYSVNFDDGHLLYLCLDISHDITTGIYAVYITEYDARLCKSKEEMAYHYSNIFGPFFDDMPLNNQELYEKTRLWHTRIIKHLRITSHASN